MTSTMFGQQMTRLGITKRKSSGVMWYEGLGFEERDDGFPPMTNGPLD